MINKIGSKLSNSTEHEDRNAESFQDCTSCRVVGAAGFCGLGAYALRESKIVSRAPGRAKAAVGLGIAGIGFIAGGIYRLYM